MTDQTAGTKSGDPVRSVPLWRKIEQAIREDIRNGRHAPGCQLPPDRLIATTYGANRLTARRALASLEQQGLIRIEHGKGTFVAEDRVEYNLGERVRFDQNLRQSDVALMRRIVRSAISEANPQIARHLGLPEQVPVLELEVAAYADERPLSIGIRFCCATRFRGLAEAFKKEKSFTKALRGYGIEDYRRDMTEITARLPSNSEARFLRQPRTLPVLAYAAVDVDTNGQPISYHEGCFASERVRIVVKAGE
jgi:GntR family phosphonate transport system transcriptional regulator